VEPGERPVLLEEAVKTGRCGGGQESSPDGSLAAHAGLDAKLRILDVASQREVATVDEGFWKTHECAWSPDGSSVAFTASKSEGGAKTRMETYVTSPDGKRVRAVCGGLEQIAWTPDSKSLAGVEAGRVVIVEVATGKKRDLIEGAAPRVSPDGKSVAVVKKEEVVVVRLDGTGARVIARGRAPAWGPDGRIAMFEGDELKVVGLDGAVRKLGKALAFSWK
jgi:Tol biopolymer transport system component